MPSSLQAVRRAPLPVRLLVVVAVAACDESAAPVDNPTPGIVWLSPDTATEGAAARTLDVVGTDFVPGSTARVDDAERPTTFVSRTALRVAVTAADLARPRLARVTVVNPAPGGGTSNAATVRVAARPIPPARLDAVAPTTVVAGSGALRVTLTGSGFVAGSVVIAGATPVETVVASPTEIHATIPAVLLTDVRVLHLSVESPFHVAWSSPGLSLAVVLPAPVALSLGAASLEVGQEGATLDVVGRGFVAASVVQVDGTPRETTFRSAERLSARLVAADLREPGTRRITVVTPEPGGGTSTALPLAVVVPPPAITNLPARGGTAGVGPFSVAIDGRGFVPGAVATWNGEDRPTTYLSGSRLSVALTAADVAEPGVGRIAVRTPAPGGGRSADATFTLHRLGAASLTSVRTFGALPTWMDHDPRTDQLLVTVRPTSDSWLLRVDPTTATAVDSLRIPDTGISRFDVSDDGTTAWLYTPEFRFLRVRLAPSPMAVDLRFNGYSPGAFAIAPGAPSTLFMAGAVWDEGIRRPATAQGAATDLLVTEDGRTVYGRGEGTLAAYAVEPTGLRLLASRGGVFASIGPMTYAAGRIYTAQGEIVDPERLERVGTLGRTGTAVLADPALGRIYLMTLGTLEVYDMNSRRLLGSVAVRSATLQAPLTTQSNLVRWGRDGLAVVGSGTVILLRTPLVAP